MSPKLNPRTKDFFIFTLVFEKSKYLNINFYGLNVCLMK